jgi:hypothetical protein
MLQLASLNFTGVKTHQYLNGGDEPGIKFGR